MGQSTQNREPKIWPQYSWKSVNVSTTCDDFDSNQTRKIIHKLIKLLSLGSIQLLQIVVQLSKSYY